MKIKHCKLKKGTQRKLIEYFVLEVTAGSAADLLGIRPNTASLFYKKIRLMISHYREEGAGSVLDAKVEIDESYFGGVRKGTVVKIGEAEEPAERLLYLAF